MRGTLLQDIKQRLPSLPIPSLNLTPFKVYGVLGGALLLFILGAAGALSGLGIFILMMVKMNVVGVMLSSLLLTFSLTMNLAIYIWLTA